MQNEWANGDNVFYFGGRHLTHGTLISRDVIRMANGVPLIVWNVRESGTCSTVRVTENNLMPARYALYHRPPNTPESTPWTLDPSRAILPSYTRATKTAERLGRTLGNGCHCCIFPIAPSVVELPETLEAHLGLSILYGQNGRHWVTYDRYI